MRIRGSEGLDGSLCLVPTLLIMGFSLILSFRLLIPAKRTSRKLHRQSHFSLRWNFSYSPNTSCCSC